MEKRVVWLHVLLLFCFTVLMVRLSVLELKQVRKQELIQRP